MLFIMFVKIFHGLYSIGNSRLAGVTKVLEFLLHKILKWLKTYVLSMNGKEALEIILSVAYVFTGYATKTFCNNKFC
jgi:hypothetical protein